MYKLQKQNNTFDVVELASGNLIKSFKTHDEANNLYRRLKNGIGFEGWTPAFVLTELTA
jgi:hypothetical protein